MKMPVMIMRKRGWDKSPSLSIVYGLSSKTQWLSGLYYADFISFYSPTQLCGGGTTKSNSNELPISVPLSFFVIVKSNDLLRCVYIRVDSKGNNCSWCGMADIQIIDNRDIAVNDIQ